MYSVRKLVYYCGFCRKYKLTSFAMKVHERHCTLNPDRKCRMPGCVDESCPLCDFARARQSKWAIGGWDQRDLKAEVKAWRDDYYTVSWRED